MGLKFFVPENETCISEFWKRGEAQMGHFHIRSLENGLRCPLLDFVIDVLNEYGVVPFQLALNAWRILVPFIYAVEKKESPSLSAISNDFII